MNTMTGRIAEFTSSLVCDRLPADVLEKTKVSLLHNLGVALAGGPLSAPWGYAEALGEAGTNASARLLLSGRAATPETAAFVNAALIHARAQDDVYFPGLTHIGAIVTPAVLAVGEQLGSSGRDMMTALVAGYEAAGAVSQGFAQRTTARGFRASGLYGGFGAAAGVARLLGLGKGATANALGIAASMAAGTNQTWVAGTQEWQFQVGLAARNGILAARLAAAGGTGAPDALEGSAGFYKAFMGDLAHVEQAGLDLGSTWRSLDVTYKPYPVCAILQAPVLEAVALAQQHDIDAEDVSGIRLSLTPAEASYPGTDSRGPFSDVGATLMSAQFCLAVALTQRRVRGADMRRFSDSSLLALANRIEVNANSQLKARSFVLEIDLTDGRTVQRSYNPSGEPFNWGREEVMRHLRSMQDELPLGPDGVEHLGAVVLSAEERTVREIVSAGVVGA